MQMNCNTKIKVEKQAILLENDVFLYKIPKGLHPGHCHKAKDWDISNPIGGYKLLVLTDDYSDSCHIQLKDGNGDFFGYSVIDCYPGLSGSTSSTSSSSSISPVADSSRYFTIKMRTLSSGKDELIGIGFISREDSLRFTKTLENYFTTVKQMPVPTYNAEESLAPAVHDKAPSKLFQGKTLQYNCQLCPNGFDTTESLKEHIEKSHESNAPSLLFYCDIKDCGKRFFSQLTFDNHKRMEHVENPPPKKRRDHDQPAVDSSPPDSPVSQCTLDSRRNKSIRHSRSESPPSPKRIKCEDNQDRVEEEEECNTIDNLLDNSNCLVYHNEDKTLFWCPICPPKAFTTTDRKELFKHFKQGSLHGGERPKTCDICLLMFKTEELFLDHVQLLHFPCPFCKTPLSTAGKLGRHVLKIHKIEKETLTYRCHRCSSNFAGHKLFLEHLKTKHSRNNQKRAKLPRREDSPSENRVECEDDAVNPSGEQPATSSASLDLSGSKSGQTTVDIDNLKRKEDLVNPSPRKRIKCEDEEESKIGADDFVDNPNGAVYQNEDKTLFWCPICPSKTFTSKDRKEVVHHIKNKYNHGMVKPKICNICYLVFNNVERCLFHANIFHYTCSICFFSFMNENKLRSHVLKVHKQPHNYQCHLCPSNFTVQQLFVQHYKTEHPDPILEQSSTDLPNQDPPVSQHIPNKEIDHLENPSQVHSLVDNPNGAVFHDELKTIFWCPICPSQSFATVDKQTLFKHLRDKSIHGPERYRVCGVCSLMFNNMKDYQYHTNFFHYVCPTCFATVSNEDRLKLHVSTKHKDTLNYRCHLCPGSFTDRELFVEHLKTEHPRPNGVDPGVEQPTINPLLQHQEPPVSQLTLANQETHLEERLENPPPIERIKCEGALDEDERTGKELTVELNSLVDNPNGAVYHNELKTKFWCPICPSKSFTTSEKNLLFKHLKDRDIHGTGQPRICGICSLVFNNVERFLYHANIFHFTCSVCMISFKDDEDKLRLHALRSHQQELCYQCHRCLSSFTDHELFVEHLKTEHPYPPVEEREEESGIDPLPEDLDAPGSQHGLDNLEIMKNPENPLSVPLQRIKCEDSRDPDGEQSDIKFLPQDPPVLHDD